jgi:hypothetical protein
MGLSSILWIDIIPANPGILFVGVPDDDRVGVVHKGVEDGFAIIVDD